MRRLLRAAVRRVRGLVGRRSKAQPPAALASLTLQLDAHDRFVDFLDDPRARQLIEVLEVVVEPWYEVAAGWSGRLGPIADVKSIETEFDAEGRRARLRLVMGTRVEAVHLVRAAYTVFFPSRPTALTGPRIGVQPGAEPELVWHPGGGMRPVLPEKLVGRQFLDFDQVAARDGLSRLERETRTTEIVDRPPGPPVRINPKIHRPVGRREPTADMHAAVARTVDGRFTVTHDDGSVVVDVAIGESLRNRHYVALLTTRSVQAAGVGTDVVSTTRLAELAAFGLIVHAAPTAMPVHPELGALWSQPYEPMPLLEHMNRSLGQVRAVMRHHTRALAVERWPSMSVILATRRPEMLPGILEQMAEQDHPNVEIVIGCHGFSAPDPGLWSPRVRDRVGPVLELDSSVVFGDVLARLSEAASGDLVSKVDDDDLYGRHHLADVMMAWVYSDAQLVGRKMALIRDEETDTLIVRRLFRESYRSKVAGGSSTIARHDLASIGGWRPQARSIERGLWTRLQDAGALLYACSGPGYVYVRHSQGHTWSVPLDHFAGTHYETTLQGLPPAALGVLDLGL